MLVGKYDFIESKNFIIKDKKIYRIASAGLFENPMKTTRNAGKYKIHVEHFDCAYPYSNYYLIDYENGKIHELRNIHFSILEELVELLKVK